MGYIRKTVVFSSNQPLNYPLTPLTPGRGSIFKNQWNDSERIYSDALGYFTAFQHRFGFTTLGLLVNKWYFPQIRPLNDPLTPWWEGSNFKIQWNDLEGTYSEALYRLMMFKHQLRATTLWYIRETLIFSSNQPLNWPQTAVTPPQREGSHFKNQWYDYERIYSN